MFETSRWMVSGGHFFLFGKSVYDVAKVWKRVARRKAKRYPIELLWGYNDTKVSGFSLRAFYLCDPRYPVVALTSGLVIDGRHRLLKMGAQERKNCRVKFITKAELEKCRIHKKIDSRIEAVRK